MAQYTVLSCITCHPQPIPDTNGTSITARTAQIGAPTNNGPMCQSPKRSACKSRARFDLSFNTSRNAGRRADRKNSSWATPLAGAYTSAAIQFQPCHAPKGRMAERANRNTPARTINPFQDKGAIRKKSCSRARPAAASTRTPRMPGTRLRTADIASGMWPVTVSVWMAV